MSTAIAWTNETWNPVTGCSHVSPGCEHCYAEALSLRRGWSKKPWTAQNATVNVTLHPERLDQPSRWRAPRMVFVNSMSDLFHERVSFEFIDQVFAVMTGLRHTFQVLTKRPMRMLEWARRISADPANLLAEAAHMLGWSDEAECWLANYVNGQATGHDKQVGTWPLPNVWLGVSVEDQRRADERIPLLLETPAAVRFISAEPLLGPINLQAVGNGPWRNALTGCGDRAGPQGIEHMDVGSALDWVIIGGESGSNHRPMDPVWAEEIAAQCTKAGCALFVKQDSGSRPGKQGRLSDALWARKEFPVGSQMGPGAPQP